MEGQTGSCFAARGTLVVSGFFSWPLEGRAPGSGGRQPQKGMWQMQPGTMITAVLGRWQGGRQMRVDDALGEAGRQMLDDDNDWLFVPVRKVCRHRGRQTSPGQALLGLPMKRI